MKDCSGSSRKVRKRVAERVKKGEMECLFYKLRFFTSTKTSRRLSERPSNNRIHRKHLSVAGKLDFPSHSESLSKDARFLPSQPDDSTPRQVRHSVIPWLPTLPSLSQQRTRGLLSWLNTSILWEIRGGGCEWVRKGEKGREVDVL